jgi:hypothetical protein
VNAAALVGAVVHGAVEVVGLGVACGGPVAAAEAGGGPVAAGGAGGLMLGLGWGGSVTGPGRDDAGADAGASPGR